MIYVIGPSHIYNSFTHIIKEEIDSGILFKNCILDAYPGLPNWSDQIPKQLAKESFSSRVWIVSDYKFNNFDYDKILNLGPDLFLPTVGRAGNVDRNYLEPYHIRTLGDHSLKCIDYIIERFPDIKLIFWCLYKRTKVSKTSSYPSDLWYDSIKIRYSRNIIDIDCYTDPVSFDQMTIDLGGHPNKAGLKLISDMITG